MPFVPTPPTHHCVGCGKALWNNRWPYAACKTCGQKPCAHGKTPGSCPQCDTDSDRAYDASKGN